MGGFFFSRGNMVTDQAPADTAETDGDTPISILAAATDVAEPPTPETPVVEAETAAPETAEAPVEADPEVTPETVAEVAPETPASAPITEPTAPAASFTPAAQAVDQQRIQALEQEVVQHRQQVAMAQLDQQVAAFETDKAREYLGIGYTEDQAAMMARQVGDVQRTAYLGQEQFRAQLEQERDLERGRARAASHYAKEHGGDSSEYLPFNSPDAMDAYGRQRKQSTGQATEIAELKARLDKQDQDKVPSQDFASGAGEPLGELSGDALEQAIGTGRAKLTPENIKKMESHYRAQGLGA
jgi:hypothetical protein